MIVYRDQRSSADPHRLLSDIASRLAGSASSGPSHELAAGTLIETGILESAVADAVFPRVDGTDPLTEAFRRTSVAAGHVLWYTWHGDPGHAAIWWSRFSMALHAIDSRGLPPTVETTEPEGYAYYSLYPETYIQAARSCFDTLGRIRAICLGIRSIGCSLSAVVAASLEEMGCSVESFTLRPRGHPFSRSPNITDELARRFAACRGAHFLLIDEGPGLSGSSLAGTAALLNQLGIADDHIHFFPGWRSDGSQLRSPAARDHWPRHRQFTCSFEEVWLERGQLQETFPGTLHDISAGTWRARVLPEEYQHPAVHPQHERRKYLLSTGRGSEAKLLSFAGLGTGTARKLARLVEIAEAGFTPAPEKLAHGFMQRAFVPGQPVQQASAGQPLLDFVASYLAYLYRYQEAEPTTSASTIQEMVRVNVAEGLKDVELDRQVDRLSHEAWTERPVALDGRMLAHEWILTAGGYLKVDAMDHHADHFFPGSQDIAWDVVGAGIELGLNRPSRAYLVDRYRLLSGDLTIESRLHPYAAAYLAFRMGYTSLSAEVLGESDDGQKFRRERQRYGELLCRELRTPEGTWHA